MSPVRVSLTILLAAAERSLNSLEMLEAGAGRSEIIVAEASSTGALVGRSSDVNEVKDEGRLSITEAGNDIVRASAMGIAVETPSMYVLVGSSCDTSVVKVAIRESTLEPGNAVASSSTEVVMSGTC